MEHHDKLLKIISSDLEDIKELVLLTGCDVFTFFQGANLNGLDLSNQDLTGMNFDGADLHRTKLQKIQFDIGAFNNAHISEHYDYLRDQFDLKLSDMFFEGLNTLHVFYCFRRNTFAQFKSFTGLTFKRMAELSGVSTGTIRKADDAQPVSHWSGISLARFLAGFNLDFEGRKRRLWASSLHYTGDRSIYGIPFFKHSDLFSRSMKTADSSDYQPMPQISFKQPMVAALELRPNGVFMQIKSDDYYIYTKCLSENKELLVREEGLNSPSFLRRAFPEIF